MGKQPPMVTLTDAERAELARYLSFWGMEWSNSLHVFSSEHEEEIEKQQCADAAWRDVDYVEDHTLPLTVARVERTLRNISKLPRSGWTYDADGDRKVAACIDFVERMRDRCTAVRLTHTMAPVSQN